GKSQAREAMKTRIARFAVMSLAAAFVLQPSDVRGQQTSPAQQHEEHHPDAAAPPTPTTGGPQTNLMNMMARMKATDARLDALVKKMNDAKGTAKTDAIAE